MAKLHVKKVRRIRGVTVDSLPMVIGRSSESALVLPHNAVSRHHCIIESADGQARIRDLGSRYGTRVNGEKVAIAPLYDGDRIGVGPFEITFVDPSAPVSLSDDDGDVSSASSMFEGSDVEDTSTVESDELHLLREQVRTDQETLEQSQQELGKQWAELEEARHELQQHREQIEQQREEMQAQIAVWEESKQGLEAKQDRIAVELEKLTGELVRAHAETETERQRAESLETKLTSERQRYQEELQRLNQQVQESAAAHRAADANVDSQREELSRLQRDLEAKTERLTRATSLAATLKEKVHALEVAHKDFSRRMEQRKPRWPTWCRTSSSCTRCLSVSPPCRRVCERWRKCGRRTASGSRRHSSTTLRGEPGS